jgi:hypothetical protein
MNTKRFIFCLMAMWLLFQQSAVFAAGESLTKAIPRVNNGNQDQQAQNPISAKECPVVYDNKAYTDQNNIPRIDSEAASIVREDGSRRQGNTYSQNFWMLLFGAYLFLLIFNLSFEFEKKEKLQWFWESLFTFLAIYVWDNLDVGRVNSWFPGAVLESGIIIYAFYFYFLDKKTKANK